MNSLVNKKFILRERLNNKYIGVWLKKTTVGKLCDMTEKWYERTERIRREKNITLDKVGKVIGLKKAAVSQKLSGKRPTTVDELIAIASLLDTTIDELCCDDPAYKCSKPELDAINAFRSIDDSKQEMILKIMETFIE